jgi:hypothetical protein
VEPDVFGKKVGLETVEGIELVWAEMDDAQPQRDDTKLIFEMGQQSGSLTLHQTVWTKQDDSHLSKPV